MANIQPKFLSNFTPPGSNSSYKFRAGALFYGTTSESSSAMTVSIPGVSGYYTGLTLILTMGANTSENGCTINVNGYGDIPMVYGSSQQGSYFVAGATYLFVYTGSVFKAIHSYDKDTTYSSMSLADGQAGTSETLHVITPKNLKSIINYHAPMKDGTGATGSWGISITGNAATATQFASKANVTLTGDLEGSSSSYRGWNITAKIKQGVVTNANLAGSITNDKLVNSSFTIQSGSQDHIVKLGDKVLSKDFTSWLGLSKIMTFVGVSVDTRLVNGFTGTPTIIQGQTDYSSPSAGDTILHDTTGKQFIWTGSSWYEIGNGLLYDLQGTAAGLIAALDVNDSEVSGNTFVSAVKQVDGVIQVSKKALVTTGKWSGEAGSVAWANVTGKPSTYAPSAHSHSYVKTKGVNSHSYTPAGTISTPSITVAKTMTNVVNASFNEDILVLTSTSVMSNATATSSKPTFTGTATTLSHTITTETGTTT